MPIKNLEARRKYAREWIAKRRSDWFEENGQDGCTDCGSMLSLEIDHKDPKDKVSHRIWSWAIPRRNKELEKCTIRCKPCHIKKTKQDYKNEFGVPEHGTMRRYKSRSYQCSCELCKSANARRVSRNRREFGRK